MAFKSAPKWIHQKMDEQALNQAVILISRDIPELRRLMQVVTDEVFNFVITKDLAYDDQEIDFFFNEFSTDFPKLKPTIKDIKNLTFKIHRDLIALNKTGWNLIPEAEQKFKLMSKSTYYLLKRYNSIQNLIGRYNGFSNNENSAPSAKVKQSIMNMCDSINNHYENFDKDLEGFYQYASSVPLYFEGK